MSVNFFYYNLISQDITSFSATNENAEYPLTNLKTDFTSDVFRSTAATDSIVIDLGVISDVDSFLVRPTFGGVWGHDDLQLQGNATDEWSAPSVDVTVTVDQSKRLAFYLFPATQSYRFWRITGTGSSVFEMSNAFLGTKYVPTCNFDYGLAFGSIDLSTVEKNRYGQRFSDKVGKQVTFSAQLNYFDKDEMDNLTAFFSYVGITEPWWMIVDPDASIINDAETLSGQFYYNEEPRFVIPFFGRFNTSSLEIEECL